MGWKASGTVTDVDDLAAEVQPTGDKTKANRQYAAALAAAADVITAPGLATDGSWNVELRGSGQAYPTARVQLEVSSTSATTDAESWTGHQGGIVHSSAVDEITFDEPTDNPLALAQLAAAKTAAIELVSSAVIGNTEGYRVHLSGAADDEGWEITVVVERAES